MATSTRPKGPKPRRGVAIGSIDAITVGGFKAHRDEVTLELRPLTLLCGANSSGKSSVMQALLLLKQTAGSDLSGPELRLDGPHVFYEQFAEMAWRRPGLQSKDRPPLRIGLKLASGDLTSTIEQADRRRPPCTVATTYHLKKRQDSLVLRTGCETPVAELAAIKSSDKAQSLQLKELAFSTVQTEAGRGFVVPALSALDPRLFPHRLKPGRGSQRDAPPDSASDRLLQGVMASTGLAADAWRALGQVLHLPGLRGVPQRRYPNKAPQGPHVPLPFSEHFAGVLQRWQDEGDPRLGDVGTFLGRLGLAWKVSARLENLTSIGLRVSRTPSSARGGASDLVALPDVGFGVSQVLPIVVALVFAVPGQLVYLEQPEMHLHPAAIQALALEFAAYVKRGIRLVVETHSEALLVAIQSAIAEGLLAPDQTIFHWFERGEDGAATVASSVPDAAGRYGDWPVDFGETMLHLQSRYLSAAAAVDGSVQ